MMRYQRVSPDCLPLTSGRKHSLRACKDDDIDHGGRVPSYPSFDGKAPRARSASGSANSSAVTHQENHFPHISFLSHPAKPANPIASPAVATAAAAASPAVAGGGSSPVLKAQNHHHDVNGVCSGGGLGGGVDVPLQWGHKKRPRGSRAESRAAAAAAAGDSSAAHSRQMIKVSRRSSSAAAAAAAAAAAMPPPPCGSYSRGANLRPCTPIRDATGSLLRAVEERSGGPSRSEKRSPPSPPEKVHGKPPAVNGEASMSPGSKPPPSDPDAAAASAAPPAAIAAAASEKLNLEQFEWPRIYVSLSRKEKEDDFLAMKGTKLPQRPKKRAKNIDKTLQYCFPGMWLSDLTRGRYEVREKKCVKKKRRGLKGMESMDSDSE